MELTGLNFADPKNMAAWIGVRSVHFVTQRLQHRRSALTSSVIIVKARIAVDFNFYKCMNDTSDVTEKQCVLFYMMNLPLH